MAKEKKKKPLDLHNYLIGKLRAASQKWPETYMVKDRVTVKVKVSYTDGDDFVTVMAPETELTLASGEKYISKAQTFTVKIHKKAQNRERVMRMCEKCKRLFFDYEYLPTKKGVLKKTTITAADHILPIICPTTGFVDWNQYVTRMFPGLSGLQILCNYPDERDGVISCHHAKTAAERGVMAERIRKEKGITEAPVKKTKKK